ncbi:unnamed protein product, partial [Soboliphyme baturini]|uniref:PUL domain-containing protein n=1 Tax=Soboliphyme baturini TaxID=241478 RepID=A0A183IDR8_9BILA
FIIAHLNARKPAAQAAVAATFANLCLLLHLSTSSGCEAKKIALIHALVSSCSPENLGIQIDLSEQAIFYILQGIVTLLWGDKPTVDYACQLSLNLIITKLKDATSEEKSKEISRSIERMILV